MDDNAITEHRKIMINNRSMGLETWRHSQVADTTISMYYLSKQNSDIDSYNEKGVKEGYIIESKIEAVRKQKITYITKRFFDKIYKDFEGIDFKKLAIEGHVGCDGFSLEIEMGIYNGLNEYVKKLQLWSPHIDDNDDKNELYKLLNIINEMEKKIKFNEWYNKYEASSGCVSHIQPSRQA
jgi:hypothetical protein